ncbi:iron ABC transporter [Aureimonas ureilytica]|uniref:Iron ABC transporter n=1 Tax=Aureimonas ureilytica TaxID=401562 RepID=A0A175RWC7_9HYPH|nr:ABC transporter ATP-binding protein [Aureimonas ureilytica]KTR07598.1 iron ABC transporter [Aureimonas ureilytica]
MSSSPLAPGRIDLAGIDFCARDGRGILQGLDLAIEPGERLAVVGPNGAGKTSLLRLVFARLQPTRGRVSIDGRDLQAIAPLERARRIAVVGQSDLPDGRLTLTDYIGLGRIPHRARATAREDRAAAGDAMALVGLSGLESRRLDSLSGGERQRAGIARAMAQRPSILVLDEPTNHLDPRARADMLALARGLGITVVAVLHDLALVSPFADRVAVLSAGRLVAHGPPMQALSAETVRAVFAMDCFPFTNPATGRSLLVFDTPPDASSR